MNPAQVQESVLFGIGEPDAIFHTGDTVDVYVNHGEGFLSLARAMIEKNGTLPLVYQRGLYTIHSTFPDFIYPMEVTIGKIPLEQTTLAKIRHTYPNWVNMTDAPEKFYMAGCNTLGIFPSPPSSSISANIKYIAFPPILHGSGSFSVSSEWHWVLVHYASAILLAKEHQYELATARMKEFIDAIQMPRDIRFGPAETKGLRADEPLHPAVTRS